MAKPNKEDKHYIKWIQMIKAGKIKEVRIEVQSEILGGKSELECIVAISQLAYNDVKKGIKFDSSPSDVLCLTDLLASSINLQPTKNALRFFTSLYHIIHFFYYKGHIEHVTSLFKRIVEFKNCKPWAYEDEGKTLHEPFISILRNTLGKVVSTVDVNITSVMHLLSILWELSSANQGLSNGEMLYLQIVLNVCQVADKNDKKVAVRLITTGLGLFYKAEKIRGSESCLLELFKIYTCLFIYQIRLRSCRIALETVDSHLNQIKWKFKDNVLYGECFVLLCSASKLFLWNAQEEQFVQKKVKENISILKAFQKSSKNNPVVIAASSLMATLLVNALKAQKQNTPTLPQTCLEPFLLMIFSLYSLLKDSDTDKSDLLQCISSIFIIVSVEDPPYSVDLLKRCVGIILEAQEQMLKLLHDLRSTGHKKADVCTKLILVYSANIIRSYHVASLAEEVILIARPVCKLICCLPSTTTFEEPQNQQTAEVCFTCLVSAFGTRNLDKGLRAIIAWVCKCPQSSLRAFKLWGDLKHNTVCEGSSEHLNKTVWTILSKDKASLESDWFQCELTNAQISDLLLLELKTYFVNKSLRGQPAMVAGEALLALPGVDSLTLVRGLTIALDIASASPDHHQYCVNFYNKSKSLISKLRHQKKTSNPVDFNCCVGDLLYVQLRFELRLLRMKCESEVIRLSVAPQPLVNELPENRPDPNDTCDINAQSRNLSLAEHQNLTDKLLVAHTHWASAYSLLKDSNDVNVCDLSVTLECLQGAGFLLKLYCDKREQIKVWQLLYNFAGLAENVNMIVTAVSEILNLSEHIEQEWLEKAKQQLENSQLSDKVKQGFILNLSLHNLNNAKVAEGLKLLMSLETNVRKNNICFTLFLIIIGKYQKLPEWEKYQHTFSTSPSYHFSFHKAISHLLYLAEEKKWGSFTEACQIQWQLLHLSSVMGEAYTWLEQPREARCYLKTPLFLAQKLALPLRTMQLLLQLALVDLSTGLMKDCAVKLNGLENLLELDSTPIMFSETCSSPTHQLSVGTLEDPDFLEHKLDCCCLPCTVPEFRRLVLETITVRATLCTAIGKINEGLQYFKLGMRVLGKLTELKNGFVRQSCAHLWLRYADALHLTHKYQEALLANGKAFQLVSTGQDPNIIQYAHEQKIALLDCLLQYQYSPIRVKVTLEAKKTPLQSQTHHSVQTPVKTSLIGKSPLAVVNDNVILPPITPFRPVVKAVKLLFTEEENTPPASASKSKRQTKIPKFVLETPRTTHKFVKSSNTPFVIVDDDGNAVGVSGKKSFIKTKAKPNKASCESTQNSKSESAISIGETSDLIVRKASRINRVRVYGNTKSAHKKETKVCKLPQESEQQEMKNKHDDNDDDVFMFDKMKKVINNIEDLGAAHLLPKHSNKISSCSKQSSKSLCSILTKAIDADDKKTNNENNSDSDIVEGTPPEPTKTLLRPRRATRSNKL